MRTPAQELQDHLDGETVAEANKRLKQILGEPLTPPGPAIVGPFTLPEVPAAVQEAGDKAFAQSAVDARILVDPNLFRKPRSDKGKPRPKPQPAPEPEHKAGGISKEQALGLKARQRLVWERREEYSAVHLALRDAEEDLEAFIDSLAK